MRAQRASKPPHPTGAPPPSGVRPPLTALPTLRGFEARRWRSSHLNLRIAGGRGPTAPGYPRPEVEVRRPPGPEPRNPRTRPGRHHPLAYDDPAHRPAHTHGVSRLVAGAPHTSTSESPEVAAQRLPGTPDRRLRCEGPPGLSLETPAPDRGATTLWRTTIPLTALPTLTGFRGSSLALLTPRPPKPAETPQGGAPRPGCAALRRRTKGQSFLWAPPSPSITTSSAGSSGVVTSCGASPASERASPGIAPAASSASEPAGAGGAGGGVGV